MKKSELIALGVVALEVIVVGIFEHALKDRVNNILAKNGASSMNDYIEKKSQELRNKRNAES